MTPCASNQFDGLPTPSLVLDLEILDANAARFDGRAAALGVKLRPHVKTCKCVDVARRVPSSARAGVTVSTLTEAEHFAAAGFGDVLYAVCIPPQKVARAAALARTGVTLRLAVDEADALAALQRIAEAESTELGLLVELDCGEHRSGIDPDSDAFLALARTVDASPWTRLEGVFTHAGHSYGARDPEALLDIARAERDCVVHAASRLAEAGLRCDIRSVGSTPSFAGVDHLEGVTEARPGVYLFGDLFQAGIGSCTRADIALSVLTTVIGRKTAPRRLLVDAGGLALSKDRSTAKVDGGDCGFGLVCDLDGTPIPGLKIHDASQEHGLIDVPDDVDLGRFAVGSRLRVLPNHACMTAAAYDRYHVLDGEGVRTSWPRVNGWG